MKWITKIALENYRAFAEYKEIALKTGEHLLIYGENGSGKSSLYNALRDFFVSSPLTSSASFQYKRNEFLPISNIGAVTITVSDDTAGPKEYKLDKEVATSTNRETFLQVANAYKGFLDYRRMLRFHALETPEGVPPNVFNVLINDLLGDYQIPDPYGGADYLPMSVAYKKLKDSLTRKGRRTNSSSFTREEELLAAFSTNVKNQLDAIFPEAQRLLQKYFKANVLISHDTKEIKLLEGKKEIQEVAELKINYAGHTAQSYPYFLNEARLSAIALSIHLGALKITGATASPGTLKVLYLDDVFIGMDTSNRLPLLDILDKEFINPKKADETPEEPTQVIISTYDRQWYETARSWLEAISAPVQTIEMFVEAPSVSGDREKPVIIMPGLDYAEKAHAFYKQHDYAAAANAIRKACERLIKDRLPKNKRLKEDSKDGTVSEIWKLEDLFNQFKLFANEVGIPLAPFTQFGTYKKILFNALSHDDATAPHFRKEIEAGLTIMEAFQDIKVIEHFNVEECTVNPFRFVTLHKTTKIRKEYIITPLENLLTIKIGKADGFLRQIRCKVSDIGGAEVTFNSFNAAHDAIWVEQGYDAPTDYVTCRKHTKITNTKTMETMAKVLG
jgi:energy-coupling factor transporter ATP-binding protein EcfA2